MTIIPIVHCFDSNFVVPAAVAFHSLLTHARSPDTIYVLHVIGRDLSESDKSILNGIVAQFSNANLVFHDPPKLDSALKTEGNFTIDVFFKMSIPDILKEDIALIADVDVVYNGDVADLYHELKPEEDYWLCGTPDIGYAAWRGEGILRDSKELKFFKRYAKYMTDEDRAKLIINVGFFAMNLKRCREEGATKKWFEFARANMDKVLLPEQDILNICSWPKIKTVSSRYMAFAPNWSDYKTKDEAARMENPSWDEMYANPVQIHYVSGIKPWKYPASSMADKWFDACVDAGMLHEWREWYGNLMLRQNRFSLARKIIDIAFKIGRRCFRVVVVREKL